MADFDQKALEDAITKAITNGFASLNLNNQGGGNNLNTPSPPPQETPQNTPSPLPTPDDARDQTKQAAEGMSGDFKKASSGLTGFVGGLFQGMGEAVGIAIDGLADYNEELDDELYYIRQIQEEYGGLSSAAYARGEALTGLSGQAVEATQHLLQVGAGGEAAALQIESGALKGKNALTALFKDPEEAARIFSDTLANVAQDNLNLAASLKEQGKAEMERIAVIQKRMGVTSDEMGDMLRRQYAFTGEASAEIFEDIANVSVALAKQTGGSAKDLKDDIMLIMQDTKTFGDIGVDSAGRIAGAINQLGIDFQTFKSMTSDFMNFDSAAQKMGDLSALFGIQMDAMEMTYLANEDQEEFLFRMREEILDAGLDVENMSKTRQRALAGQFNMSIEQMQTFMREGELTTDQMEMTAATESAEQMDGMANAVENFGGAFEGAYKNMEDFKTSLRIQAVATDDIARNIMNIREQTGALTGEINPKLSEAAKKNALVGLAEGAQFIVDNVKAPIQTLNQLSNDVSESMAKGLNEGFKLVGIDVDNAGKIDVSGKVETELSEQGKVQADKVVELGEKSNEQNIQIQERQLELADNQLSMQTDVTDLIETLKQNQNMQVTFQLNANTLANRLFNIIQENKGGNIVITPRQ